MCYSGMVIGQDLEKLKDQKLVKVNGGVSANTTFYEAIGIESQRDPVLWQLGANLNLNILDIISAPFSVSLTSQSRNFSQPSPFNQFGLSPKYKWITAHLGHRSMRFSDYTLAGNLFFGSGVEVKVPNTPLKVSMVYGRFAKPIERTAEVGLSFSEAVFRRIGFGTKVEIGDNKNNIGLTLFKSKDDASSIRVDSFTTVTPEENFVTSLTFRKKLLDKINVEGEYAYSLFTRDQFASPSVIDEFTFVNNLGGLFTPNSSSQFNKAISLKGTYAGNILSLNTAYRRIDPNYTTHGSSFIANDIEDISGGVSWNMFNNLLGVSTNIGLQTNNLDDSQVARLSRLIWSVSNSLSPAQGLNISLSYSNFNTNTTQVQIRDAISDSLSFFQITQSGNLSVNYALKSEANHAVFFNYSHQNADDSEDNRTSFNSFNLGHQFEPAKSLRIASAYNWTQSSAADMTNIVHGPTLNVSKPVLKGKGRLSVSNGLLTSSTEGEKESAITNVRANFSFRIFEKQNISSNFNYQQRNLSGEEQKSIKEFRFSIGYNYSL